jgi:hypothetical protein
MVCPQHPSLGLALLKPCCNHRFGTQAECSNMLPCTDHRVLWFVCNKNCALVETWKNSMKSLLQPPSYTSSPLKKCPLQGAGSRFVAPCPRPNMSSPIHHIPLSHLAHLFYPEHEVNTFIYLSDHMSVTFQKSVILILTWEPQTSYASMNLNWVEEHISYLWNAYSYWEGLKHIFTIRNCFFYKQ